MINIKGYNTRQKNNILKFLTENKDRHFTVDELISDMKSSGINIGKSTVYRFLEYLFKAGYVRKYAIEDRNKASYQFIGDVNCKEHYHLKCVGCGELLHLDCNFLSDIKKHVSKKHNFEIDNSKTVLYGFCEMCKEKA